MSSRKQLFAYSAAFCFILILFAPLSSAFASDGEKNLVINVKNIKKAQGSILVAIYTNQQDYMKTPAYSQIVPVNDIGELVISSPLPFGTYSITLFHDVNDNRSLDTNLLGIPKEPYGFSNDAKAPFGPPSFNSAIINFSVTNDRIEVTLL